MPFIDTHSHIYLPEFDSDRSAMMERAIETGIEKVLLPAIDAATHIKMIEVEEDYPGKCFSMMGVHPCSVNDNFGDELKTALDFLEKRPFWAIGETGLDFYWDLSYTDQQVKAFHTQIEWALHFNIPVVIHSRNSIDECIKIIAERQEGRLKGVFHCFSGTILQAQQIIDLGFYLGIGGVLTFKKSGLDSVISGIPLEHIVLETDAPYLAPVPFRGKRNECSYLKYVAEKLAGIKNTTSEAIASVTTANAEKLFNL